MHSKSQWEISCDFAYGQSGVGLLSPDCNGDCCVRLLGAWQPARALGQGRSSRQHPQLIEDSKRRMIRQSLLNTRNVQQHQKVSLDLSLVAYGKTTKWSEKSWGFAKKLPIWQHWRPYMRKQTLRAAPPSPTKRRRKIILVLSIGSVLLIGMTDAIADMPCFPNKDTYTHAYIYARV